MELVPGSFRIKYQADTDPVSGTVRWKPEKSIWIGSMTLAALALGPLTFSWSALGVFFVLCGITLCAGHSVGMHRRMIHHAFECPLWLEYLLIELGVLVGMAGPFGMIRQHDVRDWAQRQPDCHDFLCHRHGIARDYFEQLNCDLRTAPSSSSNRGLPTIRCSIGWSGHGAGISCRWGSRSFHSAGGAGSCGAFAFASRYASPDTGR